ncbi:MAG: hypothetical protein H0X73_13710 [Chthoniobacterales bacterium]|nr:hypothetical protein [Chthoniobacterales bacterium]
MKIDKKADKFVNGHDARDGKLDGSGPGDGHDRSVVKAAKGKRGKGKSKDTDKAHDGDNDKSSVFNPSRDSSRGFEALARQPLPLVQRNEQPTIHLFGCDVSAH